MDYPYLMCYQMASFGDVLDNTNHGTLIKWMIVVALVGIVYQSRQIGEFSVADLLTGFSGILHLTDQLTIVLLCHKLLQAYVAGLLN